MAFGVLLTDLAGNEIGELQQASSRSTTIGLNRITVGSFAMRRDNPRLLDVLNGDKTLVKVYDGMEKIPAGGTPTMRAHGPIVGVEKSVSEDTGSLVVTYAGVGCRLQGRLIGKSRTGVMYASAVSPQDKGQICSSIIADCRQAPAGGGGSGGIGIPSFTDQDHGVRVGSVNVGATGYAGPYWFKPGLEAIGELGSTLDGFDWEIVPTEPTKDAQGLALGTFNAYGYKGQQRPNAVFEYGTARANVKAFRDLLTTGPNQLADIAYALPPGFPDNAVQDVAYAWDDAARGDRGAWEAVVTTDLTVDPLRQKLAQEIVQVRSTPKRVITFDPVIDSGDGTVAVPIYGTDFFEGDLVPFRAVEEGVVTVNAWFRVYAVTINLDDEGNPTYSLTLVQDSAAPF